MGGLSHIVCGWYTPSYEAWADRLRKSLDAAGEPHDFVKVAEVAGGWERNTLRKPFELRKAMARHHAKTVVFLDADCIVRRALGDLMQTGGDIAAHFRCRQSAAGLPLLRIRSGTLVVRPTDAAHAFVQNWCQLSAEAPCGSVDQRTLPAALVRSPGLTVGLLDVTYCATAADNVPNPVILHDTASRSARKMPGCLRALYSIFGRRPDHAGAP